ncbi:alpha/beta hydrolase [Rubritalea tangerina]|uniref:Alpha/beta hydrolase n=1 Tax=Rubritalea tangerina TaxID=430798 RepID=A0ABW4Z6U9_9BACT
MDTLPSFDTTPLPYQSWGNLSSPNQVIIALHGFCGASADFTNWANICTQQNPNLAIYALNLRGQGFDPVVNRRGDIPTHHDWLRDLWHATKTLKIKPPHAECIWAGESLGAIIACHALTHATHHVRCDRLILLSPVISLDHLVPQWMQSLATCIAKIQPERRIPLSLIASNQNLQVSHHPTNHASQSATNAWHVDSFSLRFLAAVQRLISQMPSLSHQISIPLLVVNGGQDFFLPVETIESWLAHLPETTPLTHHYFSESYHLLLYDHRADTIAQCCADWISPPPQVPEM